MIVLLKVDACDFNRKNGAKCFSKLRKIIFENVFTYKKRLIFKNIFVAKLNTGKQC